MDIYYNTISKTIRTRPANAYHMVETLLHWFCEDNDHSTGTGTKTRSSREDVVDLLRLYLVGWMLLHFICFVRMEPLDSHVEIARTLRETTTFCAVMVGIPMVVIHLLRWLLYQLVELVVVN